MLACFLVGSAFKVRGNLLDPLHGKDTFPLRHALTDLCVMKMACATHCIATHQSALRVAENKFPPPPSLSSPNLQCQDKEAGYQVLQCTSMFLEGRVAGMLIVAGKAYTA